MSRYVSPDLQAAMIAASSSWRASTTRRQARSTRRRSARAIANDSSPYDPDPLDARKHCCLVSWTCSYQGLVWSSPLDVSGRGVWVHRCARNRRRTSGGRLRVLRIIAQSAADWQEVDRLLIATGLFLDALRGAIEERRALHEESRSAAPVLRLVPPIPEVEGREERAERTGSGT